MNENLLDTKHQSSKASRLRRGEESLKMSQIQFWSATTRSEKFWHDKEFLLLRHEKL